MEKGSNQALRSTKPPEVHPGFSETVFRFTLLTSLLQVALSYAIGQICGYTR